MLPGDPGKYCRHLASADGAPVAPTGRLYAKSSNGPVLSHELNIQWDGAYIGFPGTEMDVRLDVSVFGLGMIHVETLAILVGMQARQRFTTPIDEDYIHLRAAVQVRKLPDEQMTQTVDTMFRQAFETDFVKDFPIFENKAYRNQPMLSEADGPIAMYRRWARQFYSEQLEDSSVVPLRANRLPIHAKPATTA